jgi:hypothetical protein
MGGTRRPLSVETIHVGSSNMSSSQASVSTDRPARYGKQLASHLGRRIEFAETSVGEWAADVEGAQLRIIAADAELVLQVDAATRDALERYEDVLGRHLMRFGQRDELTVNWVRSD